MDNLVTGDNNTDDDSKSKFSIILHLMDNLVTGDNNTDDDSKSRFSIILHLMDNLVPNLLSKFLNYCLAPSLGPNTVSLCHWFTLSTGLIPDETVHHSSFNLKPQMVLHWNWRRWTFEQCPPPPHPMAVLIIGNVHSSCTKWTCATHRCIVYGAEYCPVTQAGEERIDVHCSASSTVFCISSDAAYRLS